MNLYDIVSGGSPLLVSMPHSGLGLPDPIRARMSPEGEALPDTDWHIPLLYDFLADLGATILRANFSRYVVDLNRPADGGALYPGQSETGICPTTTFMNHDIYRSGQEPGAAEISARRQNYWDPYHQTLQRLLEQIKQQYGYALLWDAHSIQSRVPRFFRGRLPDLNLGTNEGASCDSEMSEALWKIMNSSEFSAIRDGRFKGGYITRTYGRPDQRVHAVQMEIAQIAYMSEYPDFGFDENRAKKLRPVLSEMIETMMRAVS